MLEIWRFFSPAPVPDILSLDVASLCLSGSRKCVNVKKCVIEGKEKLMNLIATSKRAILQKRFQKICECKVLQKLFFLCFHR